MELTDLEVQALYYSIDQPYLATCSPWKAALARAGKKLENETFRRRRLAVYAAGAKAKEPTPVFEGHRLGSFESMTFMEGYASTHPDMARDPRRAGAWRRRGSE